MTLPTAVAPSKSVTIVPTTVVPVNVGVAILVILSVLLRPVSLAAASTGAPGVAGAVVSIVIAVAADGAPVLSARSLALAVIDLTPSVNVDVVIEYVPPVAIPLFPDYTVFLGPKVIGIICPYRKIVPVHPIDHKVFPIDLEFNLSFILVYGDNICLAISSE